MVRFLIATHGFLADGFKSSIGVLMGQEIANNIETINAFVEGGVQDPKSLIEKMCSELKQEDNLVIFTDLMYGSVNQFALPFIIKENVYLVTGINFPLICEIISKLSFSEETIVDNDFMIENVEKAKEQISYVMNNISEESNDDESNFFE